MSTTAVTPAQIATHNGPATMSSRSFPAIGGSFRGPFRVDGKACSILPGKSYVRLTDCDIVVDARYDPPGSVLYAFLATLAGGVVFFVMLQAFNFAAAPGWLVWYLIIRAIRRKSVSMSVAEAAFVVVDRASSRIAFLKTFYGQQQWFAVELSQGFDDVASRLKRLCGDGFQERAVKNPSAIPVLILVGLILAATVAVVFFAMNPAA